MIYLNCFSASSNGYSHIHFVKKWKNFTFKFVCMLALKLRTSNSTAHELPVPLRNVMKTPLGNFTKSLDILHLMDFRLKYRACYMVTKYI